MKKLISILVAFAMMATLAVSMAFALDPASPAQTVDAVDVTKTLNMPTGTTVPTAEFNIKAVKNEDKGDEAAPAVTVPNFTYPGDLTQTKHLSDLIEAAFQAASTPYGQYAYDVYEDEAASTQNAADGSATYTYDTTHYRVRVYYSSTGFKYTVTVVTVNEGVESESKQPYTPAEGSTENVADLPFVNTYVHSKIVDPNGQDNNDKQGLYVQKNVTNDTGNLYAGKDFTFTLTATAPTINSLSETKTGYSYEVITAATGAPVLDEDDQPITGTIVPGAAEATTITLKTGQRIVFTDLDVGATVTVKEADYSNDFNQSETVNGVEGTAITSTAGVTVTGSETGNTVIVENEHKTSTGPEGILISNLPYIALALVAIGGLVAYVVIRRRNADEA